MAITISKLRFFTKPGQNLAENEYNEIIVLADDAQGESVALTTNAPIDLDVAEGGAVAFEPVNGAFRTWQAKLHVKCTPRVSRLPTPPFTLTATTQGSTPLTADLEELTVSSHQDTQDILVDKHFGNNDITVDPSVYPDDARLRCEAKLVVYKYSDVTHELIPAPDVQVTWYIDNPPAFVYFYDGTNDTPPAASDVLDGQWVTLTGDDGVSRLHLAAAKAALVKLKATIQGQRDDVAATLVFASMDDFGSFNSPGMTLTPSPDGGDDGIVIEPGDTTFQVELVSTLSAGQDIFFNLNDTSSPLVISGGSGYSAFHEIPLTALDFDLVPPEKQVLRYYIQTGNTNAKASRTVSFPVYGSVENAPSATVASRPMPAVIMQRDGGPNGKVDLFMIQPYGIDFIIPAYADKREEILVTAYMNGYQPGTDNKRQHSKTWAMDDLLVDKGKPTGNELPVGAESPALRVPIAELVGYDRSLHGNLYRNFYLEYTAKITGQVVHSDYPTRQMLTV